MISPKYTNNMKTVNLAMSLADYKTLYDYFLNSVNQPGKTIPFSLMCAENARLLAKYESDVAKLLNENIEKPEDVEQKYNLEMNNLVLKYADRDEQGTPLKDSNGQFIIIDQLAEFNKEAETVQKKFEDIYKKELDKKKSAIQYMNNTILNVDMLVFYKLDEYPSNLEPVIIDILAKYI